MTDPRKSTNPIRVVGLFAENVKMVKVANLTPKPHVNVVSGPNASGKSSLIDSIRYTLGGAREHPDQMIREGEDEMTIRLNMGEFVAIRTASSDGETDLQLEAPSGAVINKPQHLLDSIKGDLGWDPIAFTRMDRKKQMETLRKIVKDIIDVDLDAIDGQILTLMEERRLHRPTIGPLEDRKIKLRPSIDPDMDVTPIDTASILDELQKASAHNASVGQENARRKERQASADASRNNAAQLREHARRLIEQADQSEKMADGIIADLASLPPVADPIDVTAIRERLTTVEADKKARETQERIRDEYAAAYGAHKAAVEKEEQYTQDIEGLRQSKREAIARAKMPVDGLSFTDEGVIFNDLPFEQASQAEQIRVAMAVGMAMNPRLRIICIRDGSLLDSNSLHLIEQMAEEFDFQVWLEMVDETGKVGIHMRAGEVVAVDGVAVGA